MAGAERRRTVKTGSAPNERVIAALQERKQQTGQLVNLCAEIAPGSADGRPVAARLCSDFTNDLAAAGLASPMKTVASVAARRFSSCWARIMSGAQSVGDCHPKAARRFVTQDGQLPRLRPRLTSVGALLIRPSLVQSSDGSRE